MFWTFAEVIESYPSVMPEGLKVAQPERKRVRKKNKRSFLIIRTSPLSDLQVYRLLPDRPSDG